MGSLIGEAYAALWCEQVCSVAQILIPESPGPKARCAFSRPGRVAALSAGILLEILRAGRILPKTGGTAWK